MKFNATYCKVEVMKSLRAGIASQSLLNSIWRPLDLAYKLLILNPSGSLFFMTKYTTIAKN